MLQGPSKVEMLGDVGHIVSQKRWTKSAPQHTFLWPLPWLLAKRGLKTCSALKSLSYHGWAYRREDAALSVLRKLACPTIFAIFGACPTVMSQITERQLNDKAVWLCKACGQQGPQG